MAGRLAENESGAGLVQGEDKGEPGKDQAQQAASVFGWEYC